jgi:hypothetical protein
MAQYTAENFPYAEFKTAFPNLANKDDGQLFRWYNNYESNWTAPTTTDPGTTTPPPVAGDPAVAQIVPNKPSTDQTAAGQINIADYSGQVAIDPTKAFRTDDPNTPENESMFLSDRVQGMDPNTTGTNIDGSKDAFNTTDPLQGQVQQASTALAQATDSQAQTVQNTATAQQVDPRDAATYNSQQTAQQVAGQDMQAAQGTVSSGANIDPNAVPQIDIGGANDGTSSLGQALNDYASQDLNDVNSKATVKGQIAEIQADFIGPDGSPKIPIWAAATARSVQKIAAFSGMTGSAATEALANAMMESSIQLAEKDAAFYQTLTLQNLSNQQQSIINKAGILANLEVKNLDTRTSIAIQNAQNFMQMDLANLSNSQQAAMINYQGRIQSLMEDAKAVNAERMFTAQSQNDTDKFYDNLNTQIQQYNANALNAMAQFNASLGTQNNQFNARQTTETSLANATALNQNSMFNAAQFNAMEQFNNELENQRQQFYANMQYNIDVANAKWRQTVTQTENAQQFEAAASDVKNLVGMTSEQLNQLWDRADALLNYAWQSSENVLNRNLAITLEKLKASSAQKAASSAGTGALLGSIVGAGAESFFKDFNWSW